MTKHTRKVIRGSFLTAVIVAAAVADQAQSKLLIPINTNFSYWDHHWIMWIPRHPLYEAIEVLSVDSMSYPNVRLVRVFFTEKKTGKQVHYFNNANVVRNWRGEAHYRDMDYRADGQSGRAMNLHLKFKDKDDKPVELKIEGAKDGALSDGGAGLKPQGSHGADTVFLLFYNGPSNSQVEGRLQIGGEDFSPVHKVGEDGRSYRVAYSRTAYTAVISYGQSRFEVSQDSLKNSWFRIFRPLPGSQERIIYRTNAFGFENGNYIEVETNSKSEILTYTHFSGKHTFRIAFDPVLPHLGSAQTGQVVKYKMSLDQFERLIEGVIKVTRTHDSTAFAWEHQTPAWLKGFGLQSVIRPDAQGSYDLVVTGGSRQLH